MQRTTRVGRPARGLGPAPVVFVLCALLASCGGAGAPGRDDGGPPGDGARRDALHDALYDALYDAPYDAPYQGDGAAPDDAGPVARPSGARWRTASAAPPTRPPSPTPPSGRGTSWPAGSDP